MNINKFEDVYFFLNSFLMLDTAFSFNRQILKTNVYISFAQIKCPLNIYLHIQIKLIFNDATVEEVT